MRRIVFFPGAFEHFSTWPIEDKRIYRRLLTLIKDTQREPFRGIGKPEPLRNELSGYWSRRITEEHRLVYKVTDEELIIISCKYHYER